MLTIDEIIHLMKDRNKSAVARAIGVSPTFMSYILLGKRVPSYKTLEKLTNYFKAK